MPHCAARAKVPGAAEEETPSVAVVARASVSQEAGVLQEEQVLSPNSLAGV